MTERKDRARDLVEELRAAQPVCNHHANARLCHEAADMIEALSAPAPDVESVRAALIADLAKFDWEITCEGCGAPLFDGDDFATGPEDGCSGCWAAMTDHPSKRERPCYAYRVGKPSAALNPPIDYSGWVETIEEPDL